LYGDWPKSNEVSAASGHNAEIATLSLITYDRRGKIKSDQCRVAALSQIEWQPGQDGVELIGVSGNSDAALVFNATE
jgi:hypothetical protein